MAVKLVPKLVFRSIDEIDGGWLAGCGIRLLLADLDNTLVPYGVAGPDDRLRAWAEGLRQNGIDLFILSNSRKPDRTRLFSEALGVPFLGHSGKPKRASFYKAMERIGTGPESTAIVGDQIFTDIWGGNNVGITTILVYPIRFGNPFRALRFAIETPFRLLGKRK